MLVPATSRWVATLISASALVLGLASCTKAPVTTSTAVYRDPSHRATPMKSVVVVGEVLVDDGTGRTRALIEDAFVAALQNRGVRARPSRELFPFASPSKVYAIPVLRRLGIDGALVVTVLHDFPETVVVPGKYQTSNFWGGFYGYGSGTIEYEPRQVVGERVVNTNTTLTDLRGGDHVVWAEATQTSTPWTEKAFASSLARAVVPALTKAGFVR